ncbi:MAG: T9SS type A sorting domain-containing protein [Bacteroidetes bacterium]|nr:T9SS type A sorting domain-containing protein [Bacteroidota bacterium]
MRLIRSANAGLVPEAFYLDDLFIGEAEAITGIASPPTAPALVLWPNPAHERVQVRCARPMADARLSVSDATGRQVEQHLLTGDVLDLDVAHLAKGTYLITLADGGHRHHARLIVP